MALLDILDLGDLLLSWRLYVGIIATGFACWLILQLVASETVGWVICVPAGIAGLILSFRWQVRADFDK